MTAIALVTLTASAQIAPQPPTFRAESRLVEVNVVVYDGSGRPMTGLSKSDFTLFEDGREQPIDLFNVESSRPAAAPAPAQTAARPEMGSAVAPLNHREFSNRLAARPGGVTVVMFDRLNTTFEDQHRARDQIVKVLDRLQPEDRVALYVLESDTIRILHDFTGDTAALRNALARFSPKLSRQLQAAAEEPIPFASTGAAAVDAEFAAWLTENTRQVSNEFIRRRGELTMDAFKQIARRLATVRGRKNLVWISSAFPLITYDRFGPHPSDRVIDEAARAINEANIAVYAVDARGLVTPTQDAASKPTQEVNRRDRSAVADAQVVGLTIQNPTTANVDTMQLLSDDTGGRTFHGANDVGTAIARAVEDSRYTYVLGYYPSHREWDGRFRSIKVTVNRPGVRVLSRKGYVATLDSALVLDKTPEALLAVVRSPFDETGIDLSASIDRLAEKTAAGAPQIAVTFRLDAKALTLERKDDGWEGVLDIVFAQTTAEGRTFKSFAAKADLRFTPEQHEQLQRDGFQMTQAVALRPDGRRLRIVVRDLPSGATGSVVIPLQ